MSIIESRSNVDLSPYPWPTYGADEVEAAAAVLKSGKVNFWTGTICRDFEREFAEYFGVGHAVAMSNGTVTLQACVRALGIGVGDEVITSPRTFIGTASAIVLEGATPIMVDVDRDSGNITAETIARAITPKTKAIMPVHIGGWPCEMEAIMDLADQRKLVVIEDCAQSHGAKINGRHTGTFGQINSWSFCQDKIITTGGEGGMVGTADQGLWERAWAAKDHGKSYDTVFHKVHAPGFKWLHESWGSNWRLTELQAAIGRIQLTKLEEWTRKRTANARIIEDRLANVSGVRVPIVPKHLEHAYYKLNLYVRSEALKSDWSRDRILSELKQRGVPAYSGSCSEIYLEKAFIDSGLGPRERLPVAKELGETSILFLVHPTLPKQTMHDVADIVFEVINSATR